MRLDDIYFKRAQLDGVPTPPGQPDPVQYYQGEDIIFEVFLNYNDVPVIVDDWDIRGIVKKNAFATDVAWTGTIEGGIFVQTKPGFYKIIIPSDVTAIFYAGTYWLDVVISQKVGKGEERDITAIIMHQPFSIDYSVGSPNPPKDLKNISPCQEATTPPPINITKY